MVAKRSWAKRIGIIPVTPGDQAIEMQERKAEQQAQQAQAQIARQQELPVETPTPKPTNQDQVFRDQESGNISGVTIGGKTYLGLNPKDVEKMTAAKQAKTQGGPATMAFEQQALANRQAIQQSQVLSEAQGQVKGTPQLTEQDILNAVPQETALENAQAGIAGVAGGVAGGFGGAALGAKAGALLGTALAPGVGTAIGAGLGAIVGAIGAAYTKITLDKRGDVKQAMKVAKIANTNFGQTIDALNAGLISKDEAIRRWQEDKINLYAAQINLKRETSNDLNRFLSGGADELAQIEDYVRDLQTIYTTEFLLALSAPNPQNIRYLQQNIEVAE